MPLDPAACRWLDPTAGTPGAWRCSAALPSLAPSACRASVTGVQGLQAGAKISRSLVERQSGMLLHMLGTLADKLGKPAVEIIWIQVLHAAACKVWGGC